MIVLDDLHVLLNLKTHMQAEEIFVGTYFSRFFNFWNFAEKIGISFSVFLQNLLVEEIDKKGPCFAVLIFFVGINFCEFVKKKCANCEN